MARQRPEIVLQDDGRAARPDCHGDDPRLLAVLRRLLRQGRQADQRSSQHQLALRPLRERYGDTEARDFGPLALKAIRRGWIESGILRREINKRAGRIVRAFKWVVENEMVPPSVHQALKAIARLRQGRSDTKEGKSILPVPDEHIDAVRPFVARQIWAMVELQRLTGMRSGEVTTMRTGDIDRTGDVWMYRPASHKTQHHGKQRVIYLGPRAQELLRGWLKADPDACLFSPLDVRAERYARMRAARKTPVQPSQLDRKKPQPKRAPQPHYRTDTYCQAIAAGIRKANTVRAEGGEPPIPHWHPHQLRHNAATWIRREFGLETARILLGHSSVVVTQLYAEADAAKAVEVVRRIG